MSFFNSLFKVLIAGLLLVAPIADAANVKLVTTGVPVGFLSSCSSIFDVTNRIIQSNNFTNAAWARSGSISAAPTVTANNQIGPFGQLDASTVSYPAVSATNAFSVLAPTTAFSQVSGYQYTGDLYVRGAVGGETLYLSATPNGVAYARTTITATTAWQRIPVTWVRTSANYFLQIGVDKRDSSQASQAAQIVYIYGAQAIPGATEYQYIQTAAAQVTQQYVEKCPPGVYFRDFSTLTPVAASNPIIPQNNQAWNVNGVTSPFMKAQNTIGNSFYTLSQGKQGAGTNNWYNLGVYTAPTNNPLAWTSAATAAITRTASAWDDNYLLHPASIPCSIATWCTWYSAVTSGGTWGIGLATSPDFVTWTKFGSSALITGAGQGTPSVIRIGNTLNLYVSVGNSGTSNTGSTINRYTSPASDGTVWVPQYIALDSSTADWDNANRAGIFDPFVIYNSRAFYEMFYSAGNTSGGFHQAIGYAVSKDGFRWYKYQPSAILAGAAAAYPGDPVPYQNGSLFYLFYVWVTSTGNPYNGFVATMADH